MWKGFASYTVKAILDVVKASVQAVADVRASSSRRMQDSQPKQQRKYIEWG
jgi:hypothetical protein